MRHYSKQEWQIYIQGRCGDFECALLEKHLEVCSECAEVYADTLEEIGVNKPSDAFTDNVMEIIKRESLAGQQPLRRGMLLRYVAAACLTMTLWQFGIFDAFASGANTFTLNTTGSPVVRNVLMGGYIQGLSDSLNSLLDKVNKISNIVNLLPQ